MVSLNATIDCECNSRRGRGGSPEAFQSFIFIHSERRILTPFVLHYPPKNKQPLYGNTMHAPFHTHSVRVTAASIASAGPHALQMHQPLFIGGVQVQRSTSGAHISSEPEPGNPKPSSPPPPPPPSPTATRRLLPPARAGTQTNVRATREKRRKLQVKQLLHAGTFFFLKLNKSLNDC